MKKINRILSAILSLCMLFPLCSVGVVSAAEISYPDALFEEPNSVEVSELSYDSTGTQINGVNVKNVKAVLLDGAEYNGKKTQVFAYWGMPENVQAGEKVPGVVLVHGGNGTAYADWVQRWNDRGYAAIAVYWIEGNDPAVPASYNWNKGPFHAGCFDDINEDIENQWMYHAVSTAIIANSFLRNQEGVDADKVGICGVSWGGIITSYAIGMDDRFAFAAPIYGAGYITESKAYIGSQMTEAKSIWDPARVLKNATMPTLFVNGDSDPWFSLNLQASSSADVAGSKLSVINGLNHGHQLAFGVEEVYSFADSIVKSGTALATITDNEYDKKEEETTGSVKYQSASPISKATLYYTKHGIVYTSSTNFTYPWQSQKIDVTTAGELSFTIPAGTVGYYVALRDELGRTVSTPYTEIEGGASGEEEEKPETDTTDNNGVIMSWTGEDTIPNLNGADMSSAAIVKEFQGENVINLRTTAAGRAITHWGMTENGYLNKKLSFKIYVPSKDYYFIDIRLASARHSIQGIGAAGNNINTISQFTFVSDADKERTIIGVKDGTGGSAVTKGIPGLDKWHSVDIYINGKTVSYYVDNEHVADTNIIGTNQYLDGFDHSFKGLQMCIGENNRTTGTEEGMYIKDVVLSNIVPNLGTNILSDDFENYPLDTDVTDGVDVTDIKSGIGKVTRYNQFAAVQDTYSETGALGFKQLKDGNSVFVARNVPDHPRVGTGRDMRYAFWRGTSVDLSRGPITIEMDINIPDRSKLNNLIIQPFAHNTANGALEAEVNTGGIDAATNNTSSENTRTAYASLLVPSSGNSLFNLRKDGQIYFGAGIDQNNNFYHSGLYNQGKWTNLKFIISKEGEASYKTEVFVDNVYLGEQSTAKTASNALQTAATDMVRGVRFMSVVSSQANPVVDLYYIDNVKMYLKEDKAEVVERFDVVTDGVYTSDGATEIDNPDNLPTNSTVVAKLKCINTTTEDKSLKCIIAYYNENGVLVSSNISEEQTVLKTAEETETEVTVPFTTPADVSDISGVKVFVWDNIGQMKPAGESYFFCDDVWKGSGVLTEDSADNLVTTFFGDEGTTRGFAWSAKPKHTDMAIRYAKTDDEWYGESIIEDALCTEYEGRLYYKVDIDNLEPGESYVYKIGDKCDDVWSDFYTFKTEPDNLTEFSFVGVTDPQSSGWSGGFDYYKTALDKAFTDDSDAAFLVNLGDMVNDGNVQEQWNYYFDATKGYAESIPHMATVGNHETRGDATTAGKHFSLQFNNPENGADALGDLTEADVSHVCTKGVVSNIKGSVYSFDYGNAHFAVLNSGTDWSESDTSIIMTEQAKWLDEDLAKVSDKKWKIVMVHQSMYPAKVERYDTRDELQSVIDKHGVDLVLSGHDHMVTRTYPIKGGSVVETANPASVAKGAGMINAILGCAGPKRYTEITDIPNYMAVLKATDKTQPTYSLFEVNDKKISVVTKQIDGTVVDSFEINDK